MGATVSGADYQVFLSFRGSDTRQGFTDCLYHFLIDEGVRVFRDNEELRPGEKIQEILRAINNSVVCIPIFSKDYASSKWCLCELAQMVEEKKKILPVFYDVTPDDVKLKTDLYRGVLNCKHEKEGEKEKWEKALEKVPEISGWEDPSEAKEKVVFQEAGRIAGWVLKDKGYKLPDLLEGLKKLVRLYLGRCHIEKLPDSFGDLKSLSELDLSMTNITELPDSFGGLGKLERLRLRDCTCINKKLPDSFGDLKSLSELDLLLPELVRPFRKWDYELAADYILELPDSFGRLEKLERLYLGSSHIKELPDLFGDLKALHELDLSGTLVSELPDSFGGLMKLEHLSLGNCCCIKKLPDSFGKLKALSELDISFSAINELPGSFGDLKELKEIKMEGCDIPIDPQNEIFNGLIHSQTAVPLPEWALKEEEFFDSLIKSGMGKYPQIELQ